MRIGWLFARLSEQVWKLDDFSMCLPGLNKVDEMVIILMIVYSYDGSDRLDIYFSRSLYRDEGQFADGNDGGVLEEEWSQV